MLTAEGVTALGENGSGDNYGLGSYDGVTTTLRGGAFTARGGINAYGISNELTATLKAESVNTLAENGNNNYGLWNVNNATMVLHGASLTGRGGTNAIGLWNAADGTILEATRVTALGEDGNSYTSGLNNEDNATANVTQSVLEGVTNSVFRDSGSVTVSNSRLVDGIASGTVTCVAVSRGANFLASGCP